MLDLLVFSVVVPLLGAAGILALSLLLSTLDIRKGRGRLLVAAVVAVAIGILGSLAIFGRYGDTGVALSSLYPSLLAESAVEMRWDAKLWPLGLALSLSVGCLMLGALGRKGWSLPLAAGVLGLLATGLASLWSANPLTTIACWAFYDAAFALGLLAAGGRREDVVGSLVSGTGAGLLLWAGVLVAGGGMGSVQWELMPPGGTKMSLWMLAALLRLAAYPLHLAFPRDIRSGSPLVAAFHLSPVLGWGLWIRLELIGPGVFPIAPWMAVPAVLTLVGGAILAWTSNSAQGSRSWISMGANGMVLLAATLPSSWGGEGVAAPRLAAGAVGWTLGTTMLFLGGSFDLGQDRRVEGWVRSVPSLVGALALIGVPATAGFVVESGLVGALVRTGRRGGMVAFVVGQALLVAALVRWLIASDSSDRETRSLLPEIAYGLGMVGLGVSLAVVGIVPGRFFSEMGSSSPLSLNALLASPGLLGWLVWGSSVVLGSTLAWGDRILRPSVSLWLDAVHDIVLLDWTYEMLTGAFEQGFSLLRVVDEVLGGRAALLWACILMLVLVLAAGS